MECAAIARKCPLLPESYLLGLRKAERQHPWVKRRTPLPPGSARSRGPRDPARPASLSPLFIINSRAALHTQRKPAWRRPARGFSFPWFLPQPRAPPTPARGPPVLRCRPRAEARGQGGGAASRHALRQRRSRGGGGTARARGLPEEAGPPEEGGLPERRGYGRVGFAAGSWETP